MSDIGLPQPTVMAAKTNVRIGQDEAAHILTRLEGLAVDEAHHALKFRVGLVSAPLARVIEQGLAEARRFGIRSHEMVVGSWTVSDGDVVTRLRRMAHGMADWITTRTTNVEIEFRVVTWWNPTGEGATSDSEPTTDGKKVT